MAENFAKVGLNQLTGAAHDSSLAAPLREHRGGWGSARAGSNPGGGGAGGGGTGGGGGGATQHETRLRLGDARHHLYFFGFWFLVTGTSREERRAVTFS